MQPLKIAIMAMGGEGGGVLADWIVALGEAEGWLAQATSVPGVAQRTGATLYYVELYPKATADADGAQPVLALMPLPGDVDVVLASELMEGGRAVARGLVTPERTTLIASTHRVYSIAEKSAMGDGRVDSDALLAHARAASKRLVAFDMADAAERAQSVISAVLFGALAGTGALPFPRAAFEATVAAGGVGVAPSLKAFAVAFDEAAGGPPPRGPLPAETVAAPAAAALDGTTDAPPAPPDAGPRHPERSEGSRPPPAAAAVDARIQALLARIDGELPAAARTLAREGVRRLIDYQDLAYAGAYLDRLATLARAPGGGDATLVAETARHLALWMAYEDTARVADLKTRAERFARVRDEVRVGPGQVLAIDEYLHPRVQEIAETLPASLGRRIEKPGWLRDRVEALTKDGRVVTTSSLGGFLLLRAVAAARRWRRRTTRFAAENAAIEAWLGRVAAAAARDPALATEIVRCQRLVKGYSDTHERGMRRFDALMAAVDRAGAALAPATLRELRDAALADEHGHALRDSLDRHALAA